MFNKSVPPLWVTFAAMEPKLDQDYWNGRYLEGETGWDVGYPSTPLKTYIDQLSNKELRILIPGCGSAYEAEYLWKNGFRNTFVIDFAPEALKRFSERVPEFPKAQLIQGDFFEHEGKYDLVMEQTFFCAISPKLRSKYAESTAKMLKTGGKLAGLLFNDGLNTDKPPFGGTAEEYRGYFERYYDFSVFEPATNSIGPRQGRELFIILKKKQQ